MARSSKEKRLPHRIRCPLRAWVWLIVVRLVPINSVEGVELPHVALHSFSWDGRKDKTFVAGGAAGKLLLNKKGWLGHDEIVLHKGEGPVSAIAWR